MDGELSIEERAVIMGHVPKEEFKGNPDKWVDAAHWVERAEKLLPISKATVNKLTTDIAELKRAAEGKETALTQEIAGLKKTLGEFAEFSKKSEERAYKKALTDLEARQRQAVADADTEAFEQIKTELDDLKQHPAVTGTAVTDTGAGTGTAGEVKKGWPAESDPVIYTEWAAENEWVSDVDMAIYARQVDMHLQNTKTFPTQRAQLDAITEQVKKKFPEQFKTENDNKGKPQTVEGGGDGGSPDRGDGKKNYNNLTAEEKRVCDEWTGKDGKGTGTVPGFTREDWVKQYFAGK